MAGREQSDADAGHVLRQAERHGQQAVQKAERHPGQRGQQNAGPQVGAS